MCCRRVPPTWDNRAERSVSPIVYAIPVFLGSVLLEAWLAHRLGRADVLDVADSITSLHHGLLSQIGNVFVGAGFAAVYISTWQQHAGWRWPMDSALAWVAALLLYDLCYYWSHRLGHEVAFLWASHVVHHSSEHYNLATGLRQTFTATVGRWLFVLPLALLGVPPAMLLTVALIDLLYQYWPHTRLVGRLGWLDRVLVTPSNHRVHHGQNDYCMDVNYGGILILWDRLFGTYAAERDDEPVVYGVRGALRSYNPLWGNGFYFVDLWNQSRRARGWRAKLNVWLGPPGGWRPEGRAWDRFDAAAFRRFAPPVSAPVLRYAALMYLLTLALATAFLVFAKQLPTPWLVVSALWLLASMVSVGALLEGRLWALRAERARWVLGAALLAAWLALSPGVA